MEFDVMTRATTWDHVADLARRTEAAGFSGMLFTEGHQVPWMNIAAASMAAPSLHFSTGIAIAFARSPMISAEIAWELAQNTKGKFRLGLGSQVKAHIQRRYASTFDKPAPQMKDYVQAVKACLRAFRREGPLQHDGPYYKLSLLTEQWTPPRHEHEDIKVDISAVGPIMVRVAGEVADGVHVHPAVLRAVIEAAGPDRVALVTDATAAAGLGDGEFRLGAVQVDVVDQVARVRGASTIAGSTATMDQLFNTVAGHGSDRDAALAAAVRMTSTTPARALGIAGAGSLHAGAEANLVALELDYRVGAVMAHGSWVSGP